MYDPAALDLSASIPRRGGLPFDEIRRSTAHYYGLVSLMDANFGRILEAIDEAGISDRTIVVYTSDHGNLLGHHGLSGKAFLFDDDARLPFIIRYPGQPAAGRVVDGLAEQIDVLPTLLELAGVTTPEAIEGRSLLAMIEGRDPGRSTVYAEAAARGKHPDLRMLRTRRFKLVTKGTGGGRLFDLATDPLERFDLWDDPDYAATRGRLERLLAQRIAQIESHPVQDGPRPRGPVSTTEQR